MIHTDWIERWAMYSPEKVAISEFETGRSMTYRELHTTSLAVAEFLAQHHIGKGDRVAMLSENCLEHFFLFAAALKTGCIVVPLNFRLSAPEIEYMLQDSTPTLLVCQEKYLPLVQSCPSAATIPCVLPLGALTTMNFDEHRANRAAKVQTVMQETDPVFILYTSGTTGFPKGALYTYQMMFWNAINTALRLNITAEDRTIISLPLFHTGGWNVYATPFLQFGASFILMQSFQPDIILRLLEAEKMTLFMGVPTMLAMLAQTPGFAEADLRSLRYVIVGGEPMPVPLIKTWHGKGIPVRQGFGMTEAGPNLFSLHQDDATRKIGSIGIPNFYVQTRIVDESGAEVERGKAGELLIAGPVVTPGYWNNPAASAETIVHGWLHTGDIVRQDEEGFYYVVDRKKNMYISGGENVYPVEVERVLYSHPGIADVAVIGVPHERWGETGKAFIVTRSGVMLTEEDLRSYCLERLAKYKIPQYFQFLEALPKNDTGKIHRRALKDL